MDPAARRRLVSEWLNPAGDGLLASFSPPSMSQQALRGEVVEIVEAVDECLPAGISETDMRVRLIDAGKIIRRAAKHRGWPIISAFIEAIQQVNACAPRDVGNAKICAASEWYARFGNLGIWRNDQEVIAGLVSQGIASLADLRRAGADIAISEVGGAARRVSVGVVKQIANERTTK